VVPLLINPQKFLYSTQHWLFRFHRVPHCSRKGATPTTRTARRQQHIAMYEQFYSRATSENADALRKLQASWKPENGSPRVGALSFPRFRFSAARATRSLSRARLAEIFLNVAAVLLLLLPLLLLPERCCCCCRC